MRRWMVLAGIAFLLSGCGSAGNEEPSPPPAAASSAAGSPTASGPTILVQVGDAPSIRAEIADTAAERSQGLMNRPAVPDGTGMLFVFAGPTGSRFYMWQTLVPLSIAFVDEDRVVSIAEMSPCPASMPGDCPLYGADGPYTLAVEAPANWFSDAGVQPGDPVRFEPPPPTAAS
jgi:uncharacterized membrane protein (UPF0127 family)